MSDESPGFMVAVVGACAAVGGALVTGVLNVLSARPTALASQQQVLNASFAQFMDNANAKIGDLENRLNADEQYINSLVEILRKNNIDVPRRPASSVVFLVPPTRIKGAL